MNRQQTSDGLEVTNQTLPFSGTVLVVEDEESLRLAVCTVLRKKGFSVIEAANGSEAMDLVRLHQNGIDLILLDLTLPGASSREVFQEAQRLRPEVKVILTSAHNKETVDTSFAGLRVERFIRKPFQLSELVRLIAEPVTGDAN